MKNLTLVMSGLFAVFACTTLLACAPPETPPTREAEPTQEEDLEIMEPTDEEISMDDVKREAREALDTAGELAAQKRQEYQERLSRQLSKLDEEMQQASEDLDEAGDAVKEQYSATMAELNDRMERARARAEELQDKSGEAWQDMREGLDRAVQEMEAALQEAREAFEQEANES